MKQCPKCGYVRQPGDTAPDYECPNCGVVYEKFLQRQALMAAGDAGPMSVAPAVRGNGGRLVPCQDCGRKISPAARFCPACGWQGAGDNESGEVAVVDVKMPFMSMVTFMVKWAVAAIPAIIILLFLVMVFGEVLKALFGR